MSRSRIHITACLTLALALAGCGTIKTTNSPRTGTEQLLLTSAWDDALQKVDFTPLTGVPVFLDTANLASTDQGWMISSIRQAMLAKGVLLRPKLEQAQWVVVASVGAYGTDEQNWLLGISQTTIPPTITGVPAGTIPKISLAERNTQQGVAKLGLFAYERGSGRLAWRSGTVMATSNAKEVYLGGVGPIRTGSIRERADFLGVEVPIVEEPTKARRGRVNPSMGAANSSLPPAAADLDGFRP